MRVGLVDESYDNRGKSDNQVEPQFSNISKSAALPGIRIDKLIDILRMKGILTNAELDEIETASRELFADKNWAFREVPD